MLCLSPEAHSSAQRIIVQIGPADVRGTAGGSDMQRVLRLTRARVLVLSDSSLDLGREAASRRRERRGGLGGGGGVPVAYFSCRARGEEGLGAGSWYLIDGCVDSAKHASAAKAAALPKGC